MFGFVLAQATATPAPGSVTVYGQDTRPYIDLLNSWQSLGVGMALLGVLAMALVVVGVGVFYIMRPRAQSQYNANETLRQQLVTTIAEERQENMELKRKTDEREEKNAENWAAFSDASNRIADQMKRTNDLIEANNTRGQERDAAQKQLATAITTIVEEGSKPLQEMARILNEMNTRTAGWDQIIAIIPKLESRLEALKSDAEKHSTKPIPAITVEVMPDRKPDTEAVQT